MGGMFDSVCESNVDSLRLQTGSWWGSNQEGGATIIYLEAMETAALGERWGKTKQPFSPTVPPASATTDPIAFLKSFIQEASHDLSR